MSDEAERESIRTRLRENNWAQTAWSSRFGETVLEIWMHDENPPVWWRRSVLRIEWDETLTARGANAEAQVPLAVAAERLREIAECFATNEGV